MGITKDRGYYYWVKRVPKRFEGLVLGSDGKPVKQVRQALFTDSRAEAELKAVQIEAARMAEWEAIAAGDSKSARAHYEAARKLAQARGFSYKPMEAVAEGDLFDLVTRLLSMSKNGQLTAPPVETEAVLGAVPEVYPTLPEVLEDYYVLTKTRHLKKSDAQYHKWKLPRERAVKHFIEVTSETDGQGRPILVPVNQISRKDALDFRNWWSDRVEDGMSVETANKDFGHLSQIFSVWTELKDVALPNPFSKLRLEGNHESEKTAFTRAWISEKILAPGALDGLNEEARDIFLMTLNNGVRPCEITDAPLGDFEINAPIPFLRIAPHGRELKVAHTKRDIPLVGVSLEAAKRIVARGGVERYRHNAGNWSALVNKYLKNNGLKEKPQCTAYSVRHYIENALLAAKIDDRVRADILGHKYARPNYGDGGALPGRREALLQIAL